MYIPMIHGRVFVGQIIYKHMHKSTQFTLENLHRNVSALCQRYLWFHSVYCGLTFRGFIENIEYSFGHRGEH